VPKKTTEHTSKSQNFDDLQCATFANVFLADANEMSSPNPSGSAEDPLRGGREASKRIDTGRE